MDKSKKELESIVKSQKEQLTRYESRLKDVVTAYKGLLKEKEALELSLKALNQKATESQQKEDDDQQQIPDDQISVSSEKSTDTNKTQRSNASPSKSSSLPANELQSQIATLMNSLATLSAEKSRMEASFQQDKKKLRADLIEKNDSIAKLEEKIKENEKNYHSEMENLKSKIILERHEREKESNDHMVMLRELQKLLSDERHLKENLEMQLNDLKTEIANSATYNLSNKLKDMTLELKEAKEKLKSFEELERNEKTFQENSTIMQQLQQEMHNLKLQHAAAIKAEQKRAFLAEEHSKRLAALHEDRVANLEARLAELSNTVGTYDQLRQQDQENIQKLKEKISELAHHTTDTVKEASSSTTSNVKKREIKTIIEEIMKLKKLLILENSKSPNPIDVNKIFNTNGSDHTKCLEDHQRLQEDINRLRSENSHLSLIAGEHKQNIRTLQEKITVLNRNIEDQENELKSQNERLVQAVKTEKSKWKLQLTSNENEFRNKISELEQQLQKQRVRSIQLLEEKENEIKALKTSFELIVQQPDPLELVDSYDNNNPTTKNRRSSAAHIQSILSASQSSSNASSANATAAVTAANPNLNLENCHMLHYANEIARKDVEISSLRKAKYSAETALRQALQDKVTTQEELHDKIAALEMEVDRLERCKTREGANLEYLKNVFISYLSTSSTDGKRHMINAISTILQFTPNETEAINSILFNKNRSLTRRISLSK